MSELWFDCKTMGQLRSADFDTIIYNYGEDLQIHRERIADLEQGQGAYYWRTQNSPNESDSQIAYISK